VAGAKPPYVAEKDQLDPLDAFALLDDKYARTLIAALSHQPMTATTLSDQCEMSLTTVYRRLEKLESAGFVISETVLDEDGHHKSQYELQFEEIRVQIVEGEFRVVFSATSLSEEFADTFTNLLEGFE